MEWEAPDPSGHLRSILSRHPTAVECVSIVGALTGGPCDAVIFEDERAFRFASTEANVLVPRHRLPSEDVLLTSGGHEAVDPDTDVWSFPLRTGDGTVFGALTVHEPSGAPDTDPFARLARIIEAISATVRDDASATSSLADAVLAGMRDTTVLIRPDFSIAWANDAVGSLFGRTPAEMVGRSAIDFIHPDDLEEAFNSLTRLSEGLEVYRLHLRIQRSNGEYVKVSITAADHGAHPTLNGIVLSVRAANVTDELETAAKRTSLMSEAIVAGLHDGLVATDEFGAITMVNAVAREMFGLDPDAAAPTFALSDLALLNAEGHPLDFEMTADWASTPEVDDPEVCIISPKGSMRYATMHRRNVVGFDDQPLGTVTVFHDVTDARRSAEELRRQALHDQLTGLANRRQLERKLASLADGRPRPTVAVCFIDMDGFKLVNDAHGHRVGDDLIRSAAQRLASVLRRDDLLVRQGGDEFVALLTGISDGHEAMFTAERLREELCRPYLLAGKRFDLTASIGVALGPAAGLGDDTLLRNADIALYAAKDAGRNRVELFDEELAVAVRVEEGQRRMLRRALDNDDIVMHLQPIVIAETGVTYGYEALARCRREDGEIVGPASFIEAIADSDMMWELDRSMFDLSCNAAAVLAMLNPADPPVVACNFSAMGLSQTELVSFVVETAAEHNVRPEQLCIEITESAAFDPGPGALDKLRELHRRGFRIALDDFGTGYSSLAHLRDLPLTSVKVDRSFISQLDGESSEYSIAAAVVRLAHDLGLHVVAEGVETLQQLEHARHLGFSWIQGWYFAAAMPLSEVITSWHTRDVIGIGSVAGQNGSDALI